MPAVLDSPGHVQAWLEGDNIADSGAQKGCGGAKSLVRLLRPFEDKPGELAWHPVTKQMNKVDYQGMDCSTLVARPKTLDYFFGKGSQNTSSSASSSLAAAATTPKRNISETAGKRLPGPAGSDANLGDIEVDKEISCQACTFLNAPGNRFCALCQSFMRSGDQLSKVSSENTTRKKSKHKGSS